MPEPLYAPSIPLTPEPLATVRRRRRANRRAEKIAYSVRSPFVVGGYVFFAFILPFIMEWKPGKLFYVLTVLGFVTLCRFYVYFDAQLYSGRYRAYEPLDNEDITRCRALLRELPESEHFLGKLNRQGRNFVVVELRHICARHAYLHCNASALQQSGRLAKESAAGTPHAV